MTTYRLGLPSELRRALESSLPRQHGISPIVRVTPRDRKGRTCAAYAADFYEVRAFCTTTDADSLNQLEKALRDVPGVYLTTQVRGSQGRNEATNPDWPSALGEQRRGFHQLRPQVLALISD